MGRIFITFGLIFFTISVFGIYLDIWLHIDGSNGYTQIGQIWYKYAPNSLQIAEAFVSRYIDPCSSLEILNCSGFVWHPIISTFLIFPAGLTFAILTIFFIYFGTKKRRIRKVN
tara:strand:+ start:48 stop:389 length:342 start_codon:yes stop_codon:yes gene_type:complete